MSEPTPERTMSDAEALDEIVDRYRTWGQMEIFENPDSTIEAIGDLIEQTGRKARFEDAGYLETGCTADCPEDCMADHQGEE